MKLLIEIKHGRVYSISASDGCEIAIIDWDNQVNGGKAIEGIYEPDNITNDFSGLFQQKFPEELEIINFLKEHEF